jgi:hypothetical protein
VNIDVTVETPAPLFRIYTEDGGQAVAQLVETLHYKTESRGFDSRWCHWNFSST